MVYWREYQTKVQTWFCWLSCGVQFEEMLTLALRSEDELFHVTLYSWLLSKNLSERLVEVCLCVYVCLCMCVSACMCACECVHPCKYDCQYEHMYVCLVPFRSIPHFLKTFSSTQHPFRSVNVVVQYISACTPATQSKLLKRPFLSLSPSLPSLLEWQPFHPGPAVEVLWKEQRLRSSSQDSRPTGTQRRVGETSCIDYSTVTFELGSWIYKCVHM